MTGCIAFIFARGGSKGVPRKNLQMLGDRPLIAHSIRVAQETPGIDRVIVSTDNHEIADVAREWGGEVPFMRPDDLAGDDSSEWLAWQHAIRSVPPFETFLSIPATSPLRSSRDISAVLETLSAGHCDVVITTCAAQRSPYFNMVRLESGYAKIALTPQHPFVRRQDAPKLFDMTTVAYASTPDFILRAGGLFEGRVKAVEVPVERALDIDTQLDLDIARFLWAQHSGDVAR